ncbi:hypothetical protein CROQUDRAFT_85630 [Cronartium quercuum f. sp. fusiforme G11]|uniref:Uncharacterized protein n=1 Tax=Cronartium quercuum f. sp. fusiforme G11 TaxID=708437 RepID=A0A9P6TH68_9BASI|nr:hypothetical protein CROQUDRAFT_85630 [Cronartium quercuum f. sp. fusiforme G11]
MKVCPTLPVWHGRTGLTQLGKGRDSSPLLSPMGLYCSQSPPIALSLSEAVLCGPL